LGLFDKNGLILEKRGDYFGILDKLRFIRYFGFLQLLKFDKFVEKYTDQFSKYNLFSKKLNKNIN
jgi:hypothetical protein